MGFLEFLLPDRTGREKVAGQAGLSKQLNIFFEYDVEKIEEDKNKQDERR